MPASQENTPQKHQNPTEDPVFNPNTFLSSGIFEKDEEVLYVKTHISHVFIGEKLVYKVKRPVDFGFLDYTTLEKRRYYCEREVHLNRRASPKIYLGVVEIREKDGRYTVNEGEGRLIDHAVLMKRMDLERMMDKLLREGRLTLEELDSVIRKVSWFHRNAETGENILAHGRLDNIKVNTDENFQQTEEFTGKTISRKLHEHLLAWTENFYKGQKELFESRIKKKRIRDCHGDLYSRNICIMDDVYLYDCIEFNDRFRYIDVASDLAFLLMDLEFFKRRDLSLRALELYERESKEGREFSDMVNFYKVYRAMVRGKVHSFMGREDPKTNFPLARKYFHLAGLYTGIKPWVIMLMGPTGSGKSTYAKAISKHFLFDHINTDEIRKEIFSIPKDEHRFDPFGKGVYSKENIEAVYSEMRKRTIKLLDNMATGVILDGTFLTKERRRPFIETLRKRKIEPVICIFNPPRDVVKRRLERRMREGSISDGRWEVYIKQVPTMEHPSNEEGRIFEFTGLEDPGKIIKTLGEELCLQ